GPERNTGRAGSAHAPRPSQGQPRDQVAGAFQRRRVRLPRAVRARHGAGRGGRAGGRRLRGGGGAHRPGGDGGRRDDPLRGVHGDHRAGAEPPDRRGAGKRPRIRPRDLVRL
ncbi:MAG: hypothetical protein AVDCRST_MAG89-5483, partial [uncultured Gemmatimonadetes bacterium]